MEITLINKDPAQPPCQWRPDKKLNPITPGNIKEFRRQIKWTNILNINCLLKMSRFFLNGLENLKKKLPIGSTNKKNPDVKNNS